MRIRHDHVGVRRLFKSAIALAAVITLLVGVSQPAGAALVKDDCASLSVIAARGTDVPSPAVVSRNGRVWEGAGYGPVLGRLIGDFRDMPVEVNAMGLNYPASGGATYFSSVNAGVESLVGEVNWIARKCSATARIVLLGHSQGADVILDALSSGRVSAAALGRIKAVGVFGDPTHGPKRAINAAGNPEAYGILNRSALSRKWLDGYKTPGNLGGQQKIRSWCYAKDAVCNGGLGTNLETHSSYLNSAARRVATLNWIGTLP